MRLSELLRFNKIVIQCHDNPDADAIASGWALYKYFSSHEKDVRLVYSGNMQITKNNLLLMKNLFKIPLEYVERLSKPELLITVDCQYGEGNVTKFDGDNIAVIDHHQSTYQLPELSEVRSNIGSCCTIVWKMLKDEGFDVNKYDNVPTALYYGLLTDTNNFSEVFHPLDRDMQDYLIVKSTMIRRFKNSNLSMSELKIAGNALENSEYNIEHHFGMVEAQPCDPNILGIISDMLLEVHLIDTCIVYSVLDYGVKFSIRSCIREVQASELAEYISEKNGSGGGHLEKAGGVLKMELLESNGVDLSKEGIRDYIYNRMVEYYESTKIIYGEEEENDLKSMRSFVKRKFLMGYVDPEEIGLSNRNVTIRTYEGDVDVYLTEDIYIMVGIHGEVYPIRKVNFERGYERTDVSYEFVGEYEPTIKSGKGDFNIPLINFARPCLSISEHDVCAKVLDCRVKLFDSWESEKYILGKPGDYIVATQDDVRIIEKKYFELMYEEVETSVQ